MHSEKPVWAIVFTLLIVSLAFQTNTIRKYKSAMETFSYDKKNLSEYVLRSFDVYKVRNMIETLDICPPDVSSHYISIYLGAGVCRACFSALIVDLCSAQLPDRSIIVYTSDFDQEIKSLCDSHGLQFRVTDFEYPLVDDILVCKFDTKHSLIAMRYDVDSTIELNLFLSK